MRLPTLRHNKLISSLITIGASTNDLEQNKKIGIVNGVSIITGALAFCIGSFLYFLSRDKAIFVPALIEAGLFAIVVYLNHKGKHLVAGIVGHIVQNLAVIYFGTLLGKIVDAQLMAVFLVGIPLLIFKKWSMRLASIGATFVTMLTLELNAQYQIVSPIEIAPHLHFLFRLASIGTILFLNVMVIFFYEFNNIQLVKKLEVSNNNLKRVSRYKSIHVREINHELKGPMNTIHSISQILLDTNTYTPTELETVYQHLHSASLHAIEIINNVLELSSIEAGKNRSVEQWACKYWVADK